MAKSLGKLNEQIRTLASQIDDISQFNADDEFNTRDNHICANIKVYEWIDEDDVIEHINSSEELKQNKNAILEEFNQDRLNNIYNHVCETEVSHLKEMYEDNCDLSDPYISCRLYTRYYNNEFNSCPVEFYSYKNHKNETFYHLRHQCKGYHNDMVEFSKRKRNTPDYYEKYLRKKNSYEFKEWDNRSLIDFKCWQFGRSGGWFSICENSQLENDGYEDDIQNIAYDLYSVYDNDEFNEILNGYDYDKDSKKELLKEMKQFVSDWNEKKDAVHYFVEGIEKSKKYFKNTLKEQLAYEIDVYLYNDLKVENSNVSISLQDNLVKTSLGVTVDLREFKLAYLKLFKKLKSIEEGAKIHIKEKVGNYYVEYAKAIKGDVLIKAGCHKFSLNNISQVLTTI